MLTTRRALAWLATLALPAPALALSTRTTVGEVTAVTGVATALFSGDPPRALAPAAPVMMEDLLATGPAARLACRLANGLALQLGENAALRVDATTLGRRRSGTAIRSFGGAVLLDVPPPAAGGRGDPTSLTLPWAHIGVRGTRFFAGPLDGRNAVFVQQGVVEVTAAGATAVLSEGEGVDVLAGDPPGPVTRWGEPRIQRALALVS
jgi:ferric-dicitrate binding protein FerR (iron transport regulator)